MSDAAADPVPDSADPPNTAGKNAKRQRLSPAPLDEVTGRTDATRLKPHQAALRQAVVDAFNAMTAR